MKTLDVIRFICQHPDKKFLLMVKGEKNAYPKIGSPLETINELASIDPSWYDDYIWTMEKSIIDSRVITFTR